ncbi:MAG: type II toxin-antitoxin system RelE/ParE family toxin [Gallionella sp.]|nr:type II toxin-antitoxin system RelE/ParE family toxin [Gallionella sp.]
MITDFHDDETRKVWLGEFSRRLPNQIQEVARRKLRMVNNAQRIEDLRIPPNNRLEALKGDRAGRWSIRSMTNGACVLRGMKDTPVAWKSATITEEQRQ